VPALAKTGAAMRTLLVGLAVIALAGCASQQPTLDATRVSALRDSVDDYIAGVAHSHPDPIIAQPR
jgi:uncharacterized lipoprotein YajG